MRGALERLADLYGITVSYKGLDGVIHEVPNATKVAILAAMGVDAGTDAAVALSLLQAPEPVELTHDVGASCGEGGDRGASDPEAALPSELAVAIHRPLAVRLEDLVGQRRPVNLPGTTDSYPNWQHRLATPMEAIGGTPRFQAITAAVAAERPRS